MTDEFAKQADRELEAFFEALKDQPEEPSPDLLARVLADAYEEQDGRQAAPMAKAAPPAPTRGFFGSLLDAIGGWPAVAGLATATVAGIWIGYNPPAALDSLTLSLVDDSYAAGIETLASEYDALLADG